MPNSKLGIIHAMGHWDNKHEVAFPFFVDGKTYFYGQNLQTYNWFIRELLAEGKMGLKTQTGHWNNPYAITFPIQTGNRTFFFGQSSIHKCCFVQELLAGGKMGAERDTRKWQPYESTVSKLKNFNKIELKMMIMV